MRKHPTSNARVIRLLMVIAVVAVCSQKCFAQTTNAPARLTYDSFRTISDRNIFNPSRFARGSGRTTARTNSQPASRVESFSLVGIMAYEKGWFAFFDGTKSDYKQALQTDGAIGEYKVVLVTPDAVKIATGTNTHVLKVGMQMRREDEGDWFLSEGGESARKRIVSPRTRTRGGSRADSSTSTPGEDVVSGSEPEVIVLEGDAQTEAATGETSSSAGNDVPPENSDSGSTGNPVLDRLIKQAQESRR